MEPAQIPAQTDVSRGGFVSKTARLISRHPSVSMAIIVVLVIIVIWMYIRNYGLFGFGGSGKSTMKNRRSKKSGKVAADEESGDPELEEMIDSINSAPERAKAMKEQK